MDSRTTQSRATNANQPPVDAFNKPDSHQAVLKKDFAHDDEFLITDCHSLNHSLMQTLLSNKIVVVMPS